MCYEGLFRETGSLTSGPPMPAQMHHTFPLIRDTVENVAWSCGRGGMQLAGEVISSCLSTFLFSLAFCIALLGVLTGTQTI